MRRIRAAIGREISRTRVTINHHLISDLAATAGATTGCSETYPGLVAVKSSMVWVGSSNSSKMISSTLVLLSASETSSSPKY